MARNLQVARFQDPIFALVINASNSLLTLPEGTLLGMATLCTKELDQINMLNSPFPEITEEQRAHMTTSTNNYQSARESFTPSSLPDLESIPETEFEDEDELFNPDFYPENQSDEERRRHHRDNLMEE